MTGSTITSSSASPNSTGPRASQDDQARHKASLTSAREMPLRSPHTPRLTLTTLEPQDWSRASMSLEFLSNIERIRIVDTVDDGGTKYVVEVYNLFQSTSNIPTLRNNGSSAVREAAAQMPTLAPLSPPLVQNLQSPGPLSTPGGARSPRSPRSLRSESDAPERDPDLCVRHRYSDFAQLRREAVAAACVNSHFLCQYCRQFLTYARFHAAQPVWFVRLATTKSLRKKILARFLADLVDFAQLRAQRDHHCRLRKTLPLLIEKFLTA
ncbi:hypothetical protein BBJ28_00011546 [Nothophytophthora sp. Chile5]|nr:hypothetical protein BBJ28_00011546 [Nothophytophthora sp. Chile5]